jgi:hypothetical protein
VQQRVGEPGVARALRGTNATCCAGSAPTLASAVSTSGRARLLAADHARRRRDTRAACALLELGARALHDAPRRGASRARRRLEIGMGEEVVARGIERAMPSRVDLARAQARVHAERDAGHEQQRGEPRDRRGGRSAALRHG